MPSVHPKASAPILNGTTQLSLYAVDSVARSATTPSSHMGCDSTQNARQLFFTESVDMLAIIILHISSSPVEEQPQ